MLLVELSDLTNWVVYQGHLQLAERFFRHIIPKVNLELAISLYSSIHVRSFIDKFANERSRREAKIYKEKSKFLNSKFTISDLD